MTQFLEMSQLLHRFNKEIIECIKFQRTMIYTKLANMPLALNNNFLELTYGSNALERTH